MRIAGARSEPIRPGARPDARRGAAATDAAAPPDRIQILGIPPAEMTAAVKAAVSALASELDALKTEVGRLKARLAEAEGLADRDALTPLYNRRAFVRELGRVRTFGDRYGFAAALVYFDLDGFKAINDRLGHAAGDAALKAVADILLSNVREGDVVGRMGGDEFAVVLAQADRAAAAAKAAALCEAIAADPALAAMGGLRASYGVAEIAAGADPEAILAEADGAMYETRRLRKAG
ncbi:GGDEF domain-containing protein [Phenylobacterium sp.]|uniref:GGDEF domain-containing protein n=1 Tax=Phenylobacterium sp. TaxID=1871053 RepID=UPI00301BB6E6